MDNEGPSEASREMAAMAVSGGACTYPQSFQTGRRFSISAEPYTPSEDRQFHRVVVAKSEDVKERIRGAVKNNLLFRNLDSEQLSEVIDAMFEKKVAPGSVIIREGDEGDYFYVIERGRFEVIKGFHSGSAAEDMMGANNKDSIHELPADKQYTHGIANQGLGTRDDGDNSGAGETGEACVGKVIVTLSEGETFGELALMYGSPRTATVKACDTEGDYLLWAVDRTTFRCIVIDLSFRKRKLYESFLRSVPLLHTLFDQEIFRICDALNPVNFGPGSLIVRQGDVGHDFFVIEEGSADVYVSEVIQNDFEGSSLSVGSSDGEKKDLSLEDLMSSGVKVASISRGDYFGELALIRDAPRAASVISTSEVRCLCLSKADFIRLLGPLMPILQRNQEHYRRYEEYLVC